MLDRRTTRTRVRELTQLSASWIAIVDGAPHGVIATHRAVDEATAWAQFAKHNPNISRRRVDLRPHLEVDNSA